MTMLLDRQLALFSFPPSSDEPAWMSHPIFEEVEPHCFKQFARFHQENPRIYILFRKYAQQMRNAGRDYYSAKCIMERIRWHENVETAGDSFKISNSVTSCYQRLLIIEDPSFDKFFRRQNKRGAA
jgi:hypothetical protein